LPWLGDQTGGMQQTILIRLLSDFAGMARDTVFTVRRWRRRARTRTRLAALNGRMLADIGLSDLDRWRECNKWFWEN